MVVVTGSQIPTLQKNIKKKMQKTVLIINNLIKMIKKITKKYLKIFAILK